MVSYAFRPPAGIPGTVTRLEHATIEPQFLLATSPPTAHGQPMVVDGATGRCRALVSTDTGSAPIRFLVRVYPGSASQDGLGVSTVSAGSACSAMRRGYMTVLLSSGAAVKDGQVYARIANGTQTKPVGGLEAAADGANTIAIPNCLFVGPADAGGNTEIAFNI